MENPKIDLCAFLDRQTDSYKKQVGTLPDKAILNQKAFHLGPVAGILKVLGEFGLSPYIIGRNQEQKPTIIPVMLDGNLLALNSAGAKDSRAVLSLFEGIQARQLEYMVLCSSGWFNPFKKPVLYRIID